MAFTCETCGKQFSEKRLLNRHRVTQHQKRRFSCVVCGKSYTRQFDMKQHKCKLSQQPLLPSLLPEKSKIILNVRCPHCSFSCSVDGELKEHLKTHPTCPYCERHFKDLENLKKHLEKRHFPVQCTHCGVLCLHGTDELAQHVINAHEGNNQPAAVDKKPFPCGHCEATFMYQRSLARHVRKKHAQTGGDGGSSEFGRASTSQPVDQPFGSEREPLNWEAWTDHERPPARLPEPYDLEVDNDSPVMELYRREWPMIRSYFVRGRARDDRSYNVRVYTMDPTELEPWLRRVHRDQTHAYKISGSYGYILRQKETGELRYFNSERRNFNILRSAFQDALGDDAPFFVHGDDELEILADRLRSFNLIKWLFIYRPDTKWEPFLVTNFTFFVDVIRLAPLKAARVVGCHKDLLPSHLFGRHHLHHAGHPDKDDRLYFFRCAAARLKKYEEPDWPVDLRRVEKKVKVLFEVYRSHFYPQQVALLFCEKFQGVELWQIPWLEDQIQCKIEIFTARDEKGHVCERVHTLHSNNIKEYETNKRFLFLNLTEVSNPSIGTNKRVGHFSLVNHEKFDELARSYGCEWCGQIFKIQKDWRGHIRRGTCRKGDSVEVFHRGPYQPTPTIFEELEEVGIVVPERLRYYEFWMFWDIEAYQPKLQQPSVSSRTVFTREHELLVIGAHSNVPGYDKKEDFWCRYVDEEDAEMSLIPAFLTYIEKVADAASKIKFKQFLRAGVFSQLKKLEKQQARQEPATPVLISQQEVDAMSRDLIAYGDWSSVESTSEADEQSIETLTDLTAEGDEVESGSASVIGSEGGNGSDEEGNDDERELEWEEEYIRCMEEIMVPSRPRSKEEQEQLPAEKLRKKLCRYFHSIPVFGFNCSRYDIKVIRDKLLPILFKMTDDNLQVIKKGSAYFSINPGFCRFLDICNFISPGVSYAEFLKTFLSQDQQTKFGVKEECFPYEAVTSPAWLNNTEFPSREDFTSWFKGTAITQEEYEKIKSGTWDKYGMQTCRELCSHYLLGDVYPAIAAVQVIFDFWKGKGIDPFKQAVSLPGATLRYLFKTLKHDTFFTLPGSRKFFELVRANMVWGPSIIYHRYHETGKTKIRETQYKDEAKWCHCIKGFDAVSLYPYAMAQRMPVGFPTFWKQVGDHLKRTRSSASRMEIEWLTWEAFSRNIHIQHLGNHGCQHRIGQRNLPLDGYCPELKLGFDFNGDYFHGNQDPRLNNRYPPDQECLLKKKPGSCTFFTFGELYRKTQGKIKYYQHFLGAANVIVMWEYDWCLKRQERPSKLNGLSIQEWLDQQDHLRTRVRTCTMSFDD